jgi:hypothetical protein
MVNQPLSPFNSICFSKLGCLTLHQSFGKRMRCVEALPSMGDRRPQDPVRCIVQSVTNLLVCATWDCGGTERASVMVVVRLGDTLGGTHVARAPDARVKQHNLALIRTRLSAQSHHPCIPLCDIASTTRLATAMAPIILKARLVLARHVQTRAFSVTVTCRETYGFIGLGQVSYPAQCCKARLIVHRWAIEWPRTSARKCPQTTSSSSTM